MGDVVYAYNGRALSRQGVNVIGKPYDPYNPLGLPPRTVRTKWVSGYTPTLGTTNTLVDAENNIWDIYISNTSWQQKFSSSSVRPNLLEVIGANTHDVTSMGRCFQQCANLTSVCSMDLSSATQTSALFNGCRGLVSVGDIKLGSTTSLMQMFMNCSSLVASPKLTGTENVTAVPAMFKGCSSLTSVKAFDTSAVIMFGNSYAWGNAGMFTDCTSLVSIPDTFDTSAGTMMAYMFEGCTSLTSIPATLDTSACQYMDYMFKGCVNVQSGALALYQQASTQATPPTGHTDTFLNCGSGADPSAPIHAEMAQIPTSWGGTMAE